MAGVPWPQNGRDGDPLASDVAYAAATVALQRAGDLDRPATQLAGIAVTAAAPYVARDLLRTIRLTPWWRRGRLLDELLAGADLRAREGILAARDDT